MKFGDFVVVNPKVALKRGIIHPCVMMEDITPGYRYVSAEKNKEFKGGAVFDDGDTLFARITPCLENGKISQYRGRPAFGSTEFIVFRGRDGISDSDFVYYLCLTDTIRKPAEKSMFGASGRQRADLSVILDIDITAPDLDEQKKIISILSPYDDLIENNTRRIQILEEMAQAIYREWFVHFRYPGHEGARLVESEVGEIPEGWEVKNLGQVIELAYGKGLVEDVRIPGNVPVYGSAGVVGYHNQHLVNGPGIIVGRKGNIGSIFWSDEDFYPIDTVFYVKTRLSLFYTYYNLKNQNFINNDAAVPGLSRSQAYSLPLIIPSEQPVDKFDSLISPIFKQVHTLNAVNVNLRQQRDLLLPRLVSGELTTDF